jgi:uncharacterized protein DUF4249
VVRRLKRVVLLGSLAGAACKLMDVVAAPPGDPVIVVQALLNAVQQTQRVLVERARSGDTTTGISGAIVQLTDLDPRSCPTPTVQLQELPFPVSGDVPGGGMYQTQSFCPLQPGDRVTLRVQTPDAHVVTGATRIPGMGALAVRVGAVTAQAPPDSLTMDRIRDSLFVSADLLFARALQVEAVRTTAGEDPTLSLSTDTTSVSVPGDLVEPGDNGRTIFRAGTYYHLTAAALDTNYFDFVRSETNPLTGRGFINHLSGGVGVFGSFAPVADELRVVAPQTDPREGMYRVTGRVRGVDVNVIWDVYRDALTVVDRGSVTFEKGDGFCAFVDGQWVDGPTHTSANGSFGATAFVGEMFGPTDAASPKPTYLLSGIRPQQGTPFRLLVSSVSAPSIADTLTAVQISGPMSP